MDFRFLDAAFIHIFGFRKISFFTILLSKVLDHLKYLVLLELNLKYYIQSGVVPFARYRIELADHQGPPYLAGLIWGRISFKKLRK